MIYTIEFCEQKTTSTGKTKMDATLKDLHGVVHDRVSIWADFPNFANLMQGFQVEGDLVAAKDPKYGPTLYPPKPAKATGGSRTAMMEKTMEKKADMIHRAQDNKAEAIQMASVMRDAVLITLEELKTLPKADGYEALFQKRFHFWRAWLTNRWDDKAEDISVPFD